VQRRMETVRSAFDGNPRPASWKQISWLELLRTFPDSRARISTLSIGEWNSILGFRSKCQREK
jgi:hypothetical protein